MESFPKGSSWFIFIGLLSFLILNLYVNLLPYHIKIHPESRISEIFMQNPLFWILFWLSFFPVAYLIARYFMKFKGLSSFGLRFHKNWGLQLMVGLFLGIILKIFLYILFYGFGKFEISGIVDTGNILIVIIFGILIAIFPSALNDVTIRGFFLGYFTKLKLMKWFVVVSAFVYAFDDIWNEGFNLMNILFSFIYGISLAYTVIKTGAIWMSIGLHSGGNFIYQLMYSFNGKGIFILENQQNGPVYEYINIFMALLLFSILYLMFSGYNFRSLNFGSLVSK